MSLNRTGSLRFRLLAGAAACVAAALTAAGFLLSGLFADHVARRLDAELSGHLNQLAAALAAGPDGEITVARSLSDPRFHRPLSGLYWQAEAPGRPALRSRSLWDAAMPLPQDELSDGVLHRHRLPGPAAAAELIVLERAVQPAESDRRVRLAVGVDAAELTQAVAAFNRPLTWSLLALWLALTAAALAQVQVGLRPLARLRADLAGVRAGRIARLPQNAPREVAPVVDELNAVLDHDAAVVARARLEAGNLAHALKTDLAVLRNDARSLEENGAAATETANIARLVDRMTRQIDRHMARARAAASVGVPGARTPVAPTVERLLRTMARLHGSRGLSFSCPVPAGLQFHGDGEDLTEMLGNLLDNACKWAAEKVDVAAAAQADGFLTILVSDDGPGLPPEARAAALKAGVRLDESAPGSGLGLAVTVDLALLYGGGLSLSDSPSGGLAATLRLPGG